MEEENDEVVVPINISNENIKDLQSYKRSEEYPIKLKEKIEKLERMIDKLNEIQQMQGTIENSQNPSNEFFRLRRLIQNKIYNMRDKVTLYEQQLNKLKKNKEKNTAMIFGRVGELPIKRAPIGSNNEEFNKEIQLEQINYSKKNPVRGILVPVAGQKRQTKLSDYFPAKRPKTISTPDISELSLISYEGGKRKTTKNKKQKRKSSRTMKKRK